MAEDRKEGNLKGIEPDSKSQVTMLYENEKPTKVTSVVISTQHSADVNQSQVRELVKPYIERSIPKNLLNGLDESEIDKLVNEASQFAEEDKAKKEKVEARNNGESTIYAAEKLLNENGDKIPEDKKSEINELKDAITKEIELEKFLKSTRRLTKK